MAPTPANRPLEGIFWMFLTGIFFVGVTAAVKMLEGQVPAAQAAFLRYVLGLVFLIPMIRPMMKAQIDRRGWVLFGLRGVAHTFGVTLWFYAMARITIAELTALNYLTPIYVTVGAALFLGERLAMRRIAAVLIAFIGVFIILRPGFRELDNGHLGMLVAAGFLGASYLIAKRMSGVADPAVVVGVLSISVTIGLAPMAIAVWVPPTTEQLAWLMVVAFCATGGHYSMTLAFRAAPVSVTQPVIFLQLIWAVLLGMFVFSEPIDGWVITGGVIVVAAVSFIAWRETRLKGKQPQAVHTPSKL